MIMRSIHRKKKRDGLLPLAKLPEIKINNRKESEGSESVQESDGDHQDEENQLAHSRKTLSKRKGRPSHRSSKKNSSKLKSRLRVSTGKMKKSSLSSKSKRKKERKKKKKLDKDYLGFEDLSEDNDGIPRESSSRSIVRVTNKRRRKSKSKIQFT